MDRKPKLSPGDEQIKAIREARRRRARALAMKERGKTYREIALALGVSRGRAQQLVEGGRIDAGIAANAPF